MSEAGRSREDIAWRRFQTEAMLAFSRVHQQILRRTAQRLAEAGIGRITPARANALIVLFNARGPIQARQLAAELGITEATASRVIRRMEEDGWVERTPDPQDGRAMLVQPTASARAMFGRLVQVSNHVLDDLFDAIGRDQLEDMAGIVARIQERLEALIERAPQREVEDG
ncbi:MAG TPA: MarR family transcriptional regulator [Myxococcota bacterium]|nr:MarR family transcriptional regulator [Myxococcota bacterium]